MVDVSELVRFSAGGWPRLGSRAARFRSTSCISRTRSVCAASVRTRVASGKWRLRDEQMGEMIARCRRPNGVEYQKPGKMV